MTNLAINTAPVTADVVNLDWVGKDLFCQITGISPKTIHNHRQNWHKLGLKICQLLPGSKSYVYSLRNFYQWCDKLANEKSLKASASEKMPSKSISSTTTANISIIVSKQSPCSLHPHPNEVDAAQVKKTPLPCGFLFG